MLQKFYLKWNNHTNNMMNVFKHLLSTEAMVDVTLACDGLSLKAHKIVLSACSPFFQSLFLENPCKHPIVILQEVRYSELKAIIEFIYHGEVNVSQDQLAAFMKTAKTLGVKGLAEVTNEKNHSNSHDDSSSHRSVPGTDKISSSKRRRGRRRKLTVSNQSNDDPSEPKIGQRDSIETKEVSGYMDTNTQYLDSLTVPMQSYSSVEQGADENFAPEEKSLLETSKFLEQTLTTNNSRRSGKSSAQSNMELQRRPRSTNHSTHLVSTLVPTYTLSAASQQPEIPPDIKPELIDIELPMLPLAEPSYKKEEKSLNIDQSSMLAMPGPRDYQENSTLVSADSQPQGFATVFRRKRRKNVKCYNCEHCNYKTRKASSIADHRRTHNGERPYPCPVCDQRFAVRSNMIKHLSRHKVNDRVKTSKKDIQSVHC